MLQLCKKKDITHLYHKEKWYIYLPDLSNYLISTSENSSIVPLVQKALPQMKTPKTTSGWSFYYGKRRLDSLLTKTERDFSYYELYFEFDKKFYRAIGLFLTSLEVDVNSSVDDLYSIRVWLATYIASRLPKDFKNLDSISFSTKKYKDLTHQIRVLFLSNIPIEENFKVVSDISLEKLLISLAQYSSLT